MSTAIYSKTGRCKYTISNYFFCGSIAENSVDSSSKIILSNGFSVWG